METYIKYDTALLAREKGLKFHLDDGDNCMCYHIGDKGWHFAYHVHSMYPDEASHLFAPTQAFMANWLRENFGIQVYAVSHTISGGKKPRFKDYVGHVDDISKHGIGNVVQTSINDPRDEEYQKYEEAMEAALINALHRI
jgi:hypothetical protein